MSKAMKLAGVSLASLCHPTGGGVDALLQHLELEPFADHDHDLAVDDAAFGQVGFDGFDDLGEVAGHRFLVPASRSRPRRRRGK